MMGLRTLSTLAAAAAPIVMRDHQVWRLRCKRLVHQQRRPQQRVDSVLRLPDQYPRYFICTIPLLLLPVQPRHPQRPRLLIIRRISYPRQVRVSRQGLGQGRSIWVRGMRLMGWQGSISGVGAQGLHRLWGRRYSHSIRLQSRQRAMSLRVGLRRGSSHHPPLDEAVARQHLSHQSYLRRKGSPPSRTTSVYLLPRL